MPESIRTNQWEFFLYARDAWESMLADCRNAQVSIDLEQYIFAYDAIGKQFADVLEQRALAGVRVRLLCDAAGSSPFLDSIHAKRLAASGAEVLFFNPIKPWRINNYSSWFFRDHRKVLVVDSYIGYIGGVGIHQRMERWRDTQVRIAGPVVHELEHAFDQMWDRTREGKYFRFSKPSLDAELQQGRPFSAAKHFHFLTNSPRFHQRFIYHSLIDAIRNAQSRVYLTTPYFIPDLRLVRALRLAARRGVDVRLIVPDVSDHPFVDRATQSYFWIMLKTGVRIYLYRDHILHAKTVVIDDDWASVGSANLDNLSLLFNYEATLVGTNRAFVDQLREHFMEDITQSHEVMFSAWKRRSLVRKILETATWPLHKFL
ncbi:hypothetical protein A2524_01985 [Candidatus Wolfebacteria bacterium RIFOXYD12_FULL_48_21]|uniref:PLD phosphodiesterase domain-containing protein n=1 Tax=Candidatus Wolfebacteria bacterium RIFOXYD1_FULL_48_65 TaxID=1802561 RepID=A0A1F8E1E9_9BACT|nr:MAG: hypothetical protein A2610_03955 [Candidatus Wolfebacteria bacterium RIFOXYD1_FULL_48_65]OGM94565.1 MAG: hypothetical protein A2524_01985 [Candidatus Wolfebacteria bacterium RIFOXYD12_FULL_48_21]OGM96548.1 MAG: hypothetical protein A2532_02435 [Candidatus Wolfebacteria bacterium RIFOXYD2_FULL_48_11]